MSFDRFSPWKSVSRFRRPPLGANGDSAVYRLEARFAQQLFTKMLSGAERASALQKKQWLDAAAGESPFGYISPRMVSLSQSLKHHTSQVKAPSF